jgi:large subunit ribosomal protein L4
MSKLSMTKADGGSGASVDLPEEIFGIEPNVAVMHQVVTAQLAAKRAGTHSTKTRAEVRGGGAKPWRQKGTGRARQGSIRSPQWRGGGVAHGPHPRDYSQKTPKKMIRLALRSALSDRAAEGKLIVVDDWGVSEPKTKSGVKLLEGLGLRNVRKADSDTTTAKSKDGQTKSNHGGFQRDPRVLVVLFRTEQAVWKSLRNLGERVQILLPEELNTYDVLLNDWLVFSKASLDETVARLGDGETALPDDVDEPAATETADETESAEAS